jgi:hypothetical protein
VTRYESLRSKVIKAHWDYLIRPCGLGKAVCYLRYLRLKHKLDVMPSCEAEKESGGHFPEGEIN